MIKYYNESDEDMSMDVQVGPGEEVTCAPDCNPVEMAKKDPNSVAVACKTNEESCCKEFYVDFSDVVNHAELNEQSILESLNDIIACNEETGMTAANLMLVMGESNFDYVDDLEKHGANCVHYVSEAADSVDDIDMTVQVGPQGDEMSVSADPQEANPVDAVKRHYDTVVVAKDGDDFFMDVEDVQKCADLNCESVIDTLNGIIDCNEQSDMNTENVHVFVEELEDDDLVETLGEAGVSMVLKEAVFGGRLYTEEELNKIIGIVDDAVNSYDGFKKSKVKVDLKKATIAYNRNSVGKRFRNIIVGIFDLDKLAKEYDVYKESLSTNKNDLMNDVKAALKINKIKGKVSWSTVYPNAKIDSTEAGFGSIGGLLGAGIGEKIKNGAGFLVMFIRSKE